MAWWKRRYGYSANDERYLSATITQVLEDALEANVGHFIDEYERFDPETSRFAKRRVLDPQVDERERKRLADEINKAIGA